MTNAETDAFFAGAACMGFFAIVLFFLRFWRSTRDPLFLFFAAAFFLMLMERLVRSTFSLTNDWAPAVYLLRLAAFVLILVAIYFKNRNGRDG